MKLREALEGGGHKVSEAEDGQKGLSAIEADPTFDMLLVDINMPNMDGITMLRELHKKQTLPKVPILILTTEANRTIQEDAKQYGVKGWILKPFESNTLLAAVEKVLKLYR